MKRSALPTLPRIVPRPATRASWSSAWGQRSYGGCPVPSGGGAALRLVVAQPIVSTMLTGQAGQTVGNVAVDVPSGHFYLVSDNRQFPWDSREFGPVERSSCMETVIFRLMSKEGFFDVPNRLTLIR